MSNTQLTIYAEGACSSLETRQERAVIHPHAQGISVQCARGHLLTARTIQTREECADFAGSRFAADVAWHRYKHGGIFDRMAVRCGGHGCPEVQR